MAYITPIHHPSSVRHALKLNLLSVEEDTLVVAKSNRLELYTQTPNGLSLRYKKSIHGRITMLDRLRPSSSRTDHLFVGTDNYNYFTLSWDSEANRFRTEKSWLDQADKSARDSQTDDRCNIDPSGRFLSLEVYEGVIMVIPIAQKPGKNNEWEVGNLTNPIPVRIPEMFVRSSTFFEIRLRGKDNKAHLGLLYEDTLKKVRLKIRPVTYTGGLRKDAGNVDLDEGAETLQQELELGASHLIPVSAPACGLLIVGETSISYYEHSSGTYFQRPLKEATIFVSWEQIDKQRYILADEYGKLYLLMLELDGEDGVAGWRMDVIGETSRASVLVYLDSGNVFVGSNQGDCQVISIKPQSLDVTQTLPNIGPILDFTIMDLGSRSSEGQTNEYSSGQARLVTGSGAFKDGSLRSVRSGVGLEDLGTLGQLENVTDIFSLKSSPSREDFDTLLVSFIDESRIFCFSSDGDVEELESFSGCTLDQGTLFATNSANGRTLQVTKTAACLTEIESGMRIAEWAPPSGAAITAVTANDEALVLAVGGSSLVTLDVAADLNARSHRAFEGQEQIACVHVPLSKIPVCIVGFWSGASISILDLNTLQDIRKEDVLIGGTSIPRSILLVNLIEDQSPSLLIAMADGSVITYSMNSDFTLTSKSSVTLGAQPASFRALPRDNGLYSIFATCDHPSLIYGSEGRIVFSAVTAEDATCVCPFDAEAYPNAIAIATAQELKLALVDEERSTHVQGLSVGETVRRVAYSPDLKAFGLCTIKRTLEDGAEIVQSHFKLADEVMFSVLATFALNEDELVESVMRCKLDDGSGQKAERFVVGTAYLDDDRADAVRGRIIILEVTEDRQLKVVTEHDVKGACRCLAMMGDKIVAALIKTIVVYSLTWETPSTPYLTKQASYRCSTAPIDLSVDTTTSTIAIADLMKSLSLIRYNPGAEGSPSTLTEVARHFQTTWATACANITPQQSASDTALNAKGKQPTNGKEADSLYLEADAEGNLLVLNRDASSEFAEDRKRLKVVSEMQLGEMVNKIRPITITPSPSSKAQTTGPTVRPAAFLATTEGSIYLFGLIAPSKLDLLLRLQSSLADMLDGRSPSTGDQDKDKTVQTLTTPGHIPFNTYRAFKNAVREAEEPFRFVDGELLERFLELGVEAQEGICGGLGVVAEREGGIEGVRGVVEGLRRLR